MRLPPWFTTLSLAFTLMVGVTSIHAAEAEDAATQQQSLDDAALEEKYGIKAGSLKREHDDEGQEDANATDGESVDGDNRDDEGNGPDGEAVDGDTRDDERNAPDAGTDGEAVDGDTRDDEGNGPDAGTGGTGSAETAHEEGEDEADDEDE